jgi:hypothetical protein
LIVWDGDPSSAVTQTGIVLSGVQAGQLQLGGSWFQLNSASGFSNANDTYTLPAPSLDLLGQTVDALGGIDTLLIPFYPNMIVPDGEGLHFGEVHMTSSTHWARLLKPSTPWKASTTFLQRSRWSTTGFCCKTSSG